MIIRITIPESMGSPGGVGPGPGGDGGGGALFEAAANETPATSNAATVSNATGLKVKIVFGTNFIGRKSK